MLQTPEPSCMQAASAWHAHHRQPFRMLLLPPQAQGYQCGRVIAASSSHAGVCAAPSQASLTLSLNPKTNTYPHAQEFFDATVKHRRLTWFYALGSATLRGNFRSKPIDISCLPTQAAVLLLFNSGARRCSV